MFCFKRLIPSITCICFHMLLLALLWGSQFQAIFWCCNSLGMSRVGRIHQTHLTETFRANVRIVFWTHYLWRWSLWIASLLRLSSHYFIVYLANLLLQVFVSSLSAIENRGRVIKIPNFDVLLNVHLSN